MKSPPALRCLLGHHWIGCCCERCGAQRDLDHDWDHCRCRRCGSYRDADHLLADCRCQICLTYHHQWSNGCCTVCGTQLPPGDQNSGADDIATGVTAHIARRRSP
jgi:hypothetical protein